MTKEQRDKLRMKAEQRVAWQKNGYPWTEDLTDSILPLLYHLDLVEKKLDMAMKILVEIAHEPHGSEESDMMAWHAVEKINKLKANDE